MQWEAAIVVMAVAASASASGLPFASPGERLASELAQALREVPPPSLAAPHACDDHSDLRAIDLLHELRAYPAEVRAHAELVREAALSQDVRVRRAAQSLLRLSGAPIPVASYEADLELPEWECRTAAYEELARMGANAADAVPALTHELDSLRWNARLDAARALAAIGSDQAFEKLAAALSADDARLLHDLLAYFAGRGQRLARFAPKIRPLLDHWSNTVRRDAAIALTSMGFETAATLRECPEIEPESLQVDGTPARWLPLASARRPPPECPAAVPDQTDWIVVEGTCLAARSVGEYGGGLDVAVDGRWREVQFEPDLNPERFLRIGDRVVVLESLSHMMGFGRISELRRPDGAWKIVPRARLPWLIDSFAVGPRGTVAVAVTPDPETRSGICESEAEGRTTLVFELPASGNLRALP